MQTFLPEPSFVESAKALDNKRLGKQRVEAKQILFALSDPTYGWQHHPAVRMWRGYEESLAMYGHTICVEWIGRGYNDSLKDWFASYALTTPMTLRPSWYDEKFVTCHRAALYWKKPEHYRQYEEDYVKYLGTLTAEQLITLLSTEKFPYYWPR